MQKRLLFIQSFQTPNPECVKFTPGKPVTGTELTMDFSAIKFTHVSPMARELFLINGVSRVFYGKDFISITKESEKDWTVVKPKVLEVITNHYSTQQPLWTEEPEPEDTKINENDSEAV